MGTLAECRRMSLGTLDRYGLLRKPLLQKKLAALAPA